MKQSQGVLRSELPEAMSARLDAFAGLLATWNNRINLVATRDIAHLWNRHIADCVQLHGLIAEHEAVIDLGTGGGFPGLILAICGSSAVTLVEADARKCSFLREAARASGVHVTIVNSRIEDARLPPADVVTARALAPLPRLLGWAQPLLKNDGRCLFLKGRKVEEELTAARSQWHMMIARTSSRTDPEGVILSLSQIRRVAPMNC